MPLPEGGRQAARLAAAGGGSRPVQVIAVASGKGGVGKTNVSVNLATVQAMRGRKVWMLDADLGLANVDVLLGLNVRRNLSHVLDGSCELADVVVEGPGGMQIVPAASGVARMTTLGAAECGGLIQAFSEVASDAELLVVDTAAGISTSVTMFVRAAQQALVVVCDEPASITDAYALIKVLARDHGMHQIQVLSNMVRSPAEGRALYQKIARVTDRYLDVNLNYAGHIPYDDFLRKALQRQQPVVTVYPDARSSAAFKKLADKADTWRVPSGPSGHLEFFFERALGAATAGAES